jgi:tetratricopeptide (TPR) repeat protein
VCGDQNSTNPPGPRAGQTGPHSARQLQIKDLLRRGEASVRAGHRTEARRLFREILTLDPENEDAWLWLGFLAPTPRQGLDYLEQARGLHPHSERVRQALAWAVRRLESLEPPPTRPVEPRRLAPSAPGAPPQAVRAESAQTGKPPQPGRRLPSPSACAALALAGVALLSVMAAYVLRLPTAPASPTAPPAPTMTPLPGDMATLRQMASDAIGRQDWEQTIPLLERMRELTPSDDGVRQQLAVAHLRRGLELADQGLLDEAIAHYDAAIRFYANDVDLQTARRLAIGYRDGLRAIEEQRWEQALSLLVPVYELAPDFRDVSDLLYLAYVERAVAAEAAKQLEVARNAYASAVQIKPGAEEIRTRLAAITATLTPPTPTPTPRPRKRILIDVSEQRLRAYQDESLVFDWICSTGEVGRPTRYGEFQVLDKIPEAWSSVWGLRMPHWLGIYWAGGSENGIHALPINQSGQQLWAGFLGRRVSFGCIILDTPNAAQLYQWAEIGTPVTVTP